jgi:hypothetical protein
MNESVERAAMIRAAMQPFEQQQRMIDASINSASSEMSKQMEAENQARERLIEASSSSATLGLQRQMEAENQARERLIEASLSSTTLGLRFGLR